MTSKRYTYVLILALNVNLLYAQPWTNLYLPTQENIHDIEMIDDNVGYIYTYGTGHVFKTVNGGGTWKEIAILDSGYFEQMQFLTKKKGFMCGENGKVLAIDNNGTKWQDVSIPHQGDRLLLYGMQFANRKVGIVSGGLMKGKTIVNINFRTKNGGRSWHKENSPAFFYSFLVSPSGRSYATSNGTIWKLGNKKGWEALYGTDVGVNIGQIRSMDCSGPMLMAVSFNGFSAKSIDEGASWKASSISSCRLRDIKYFGNHNWIAGGDNQATGATSNLIISHDDGQSWQPEASTDDIHRIALSPSYIWIVGKNGLIAKRRKN